MSGSKIQTSTSLTAPSAATRAAASHDCARQLRCSRITHRHDRPENDQYAADRIERKERLKVKKDSEVTNDGNQLIDKPNNMFRHSNDRS